MKLFAKIVNGLPSFTIFVKSSILDVRMVSVSFCRIWSFSQNLLKFLEKLLLTTPASGYSCKIKLFFRESALHRKWSFPLGISLVNVIKSAVSCWFGYISWRNPEWKTSFFVQCIYLISFLMRWSLRQVILFLLVRKWTKIVKMSYVDAQPYFTNYWREIKDKLEFEQVASDKIWSGISH